MRIVPACDENDNVLAIKPQNEVDHKGLFYRATGLIIKNKSGDFLIGKRAATKDRSPNLWTCPATGTVEKDETYDENMIHEAEEELGITGVAFKKGPKTKTTDTHKFFVQLYFHYVEDNATFTPDPEEIAELKWISPEELREEVKNNPESFTEGFVDFIPRLLPDPYTTKLLEPYQHLSTFEDGRIDYTNTDKAPVIMCFVKYKDKILLLKRSEKLRTYGGLWNGIGGYIDEPLAIEEKIKEELREELQIEEFHIESIYQADPYELHDEEINKTWIIHASLAEISQPKIILDWEHSAHTWITPEEIKNYEIVPGLDKSLNQVIHRI